MYASLATRKPGATACTRLRMTASVGVRRPAHQVQGFLLGAGAVQRQVAHVQPPVVVFEHADAREVAEARHCALSRWVQQVVPGLIVYLHVRDVHLNRRGL